MQYYKNEVSQMNNDYYDIKPYTEVSTFNCELTKNQYPIDSILPILGMSKSFVKKVIGKQSLVSEPMILKLINQDAFSETFVPRSKILTYLRESIANSPVENNTKKIQRNKLLQGDAINLIHSLPDQSIQCVVTSTPYWAMRIYDTLYERKWADGEICSFGLEQTPEGFIRHSVEVLYHLLPKIKPKGSIWWNIMDSYNTRTQIRGSAVEALKAMQGHDKRSWKDYKYKRYSSGHSFLKDGEQCMIPQRICERASRIGYYNKSTISWCKSSTLPEPQNSRVSRSIEYILHLSVERTPTFHKERYLELNPALGGKQPLESEKLSDFWYLPTSAGGDEHGAQFPLHIPARCIAISTEPGDLVLDPFVGAGNTAIAASLLGRNYIGFDISSKYISIAKKRIESASFQMTLPNTL